MDKKNTYFEKVSFNQFKEDWIVAFEEYDYSIEDIKEIESIYDEIGLPVRSSVGSAGYDFRSPIYFCLQPGQSIMIPTGIKAHMCNNLVLMIYPRSGLGTKHRFVPANLTGIIDSDYINAENEGHIHMKMINDGDKSVVIDAGKAFCQGVFIPYYITDDDNAYGKRSGGFGSSDNNKR